MNQNNKDFVPVTGGVDASKYRRGDVLPCADITDSDLDLHIARMFALHPQLKTAFHNQDIRKLDQQTKQALLDDINDVLGISAFTNSAR